MKWQTLIRSPYNHLLYVSRDKGSRRHFEQDCGPGGPTREFAARWLVVSRDHARELFGKADLAPGEWMNA